MDKSKIDEKCAYRSCLPDIMISFNPSDPKSVDSILSKFGPEGAYEIARALMVAADDDMRSAIEDAKRG